MGMKKKQRSNVRSRSHSRSVFVPGTGLEPVRLLRSQDFKSCVSTNSTTQASSAVALAEAGIVWFSFKKPSFGGFSERKTGLEPATLTLARLRSTN
jgi:hypothetical protein